MANPVEIFQNLREDDQRALIDYLERERIEKELEGIRDSGEGHYDNLIRKFGLEVVNNAIQKKTLAI